MSEANPEARKRLKAKLLHLVQTNPQFRRRVAAILRRKDAKKKEAAPNQDDSEPSTTGDLPMTTLKSDLIRLAHASENKELRRLVAGLFVVADAPDGGKSKDEGGDDEGSEDPGAGEEGPETSLGEGYEPGKVKEASQIKLGAKLSKDQIEEVRGEMVKSGGVPVRFMDGGQSMDIITGQKTGKGANVMHQLVYWNFPKETSKKIAKWLGVQAKFDKSASTLKIAHMPYLSQSGNLSKERIQGKGLTKAVIRAGDGFALYNISAAENKSKFYEGYINEQRNGMYDVVFRWGAMTDSGFTGRIDGRKYDEKFMGLTYDQAKRILDAKKRAKIGGSGYVDTFGPKHIDPATRKKLKQGEYPIGLARDVGFGWGTQEMAYCVPALRNIAQEIANALDPTDGTDAVVDLQAALKLVRGVPDSSMAGKITRFIADAMRGIARGDDERTLNKKLFTIKNYIDKQIALCPV